MMYIFTIQKPMKFLAGIPSDNLWLGSGFFSDGHADLMDMSSA